MLKPETKYNGIVTGGGLFEADSGTVGFQVLLKCDDGETDFTIWLTEKNKERAAKAFGTLGVNVTELRTPAQIEAIPGKITGCEVSFGTKLEEYRGKTRIKVAWIGKKRDALEADLSTVAARYFATAPSSDLPDDEIPF